MNLLAEKLRQLREQHELTQAQLAAKSDLGTKTVNNMERGVGPVTKETLQKLFSLYKLNESERLDVTILWLRREAEELGENPDKLYIRKAEGLRSHERVLHAFNKLSADEKEEFLKAMERSDLMIQTIRGLNKTWEAFLKQAEKHAKELSKE